MRLAHAALLAHEARFPTGHPDGYDGFVRQIEDLRDRFYAEFQNGDPEKQPTVNEVIAAFGEPPPEAFATPYELSQADIEQLSGVIQRKYMLRFKNIRRSWAILLQHMPELMDDTAPRREVLEMSTAHGATLEILRHKGHRVTGTDFLNFVGKNGEVDTRFRRVNELNLAMSRDDHGLHDGGGDISTWPYEPIIRSLGLDVRLFDAGCLPYPFKDKAVDTVLCFDALEHYCRPHDWMDIVDEFTRIARRSVLLITNPVQGQLLPDADYMAAFHAFQRGMRGYRQQGFECVHAGINRHQLTVYKLVKTGPATTRRKA